MSNVDRSPAEQIAEYARTHPGATSPDVREDFRERVVQFADALDAPKRDVLFQSPSRDPLNKGTDADHAKAEWFAELWKRAVGNRADETIHIRGLHYVVVQLEEDVEPPTNCKWDRYRNTDTCYGYLADAGVCARVLGYVPLGGITDEKNTQNVVTEYKGHDTTPTVDAFDAPDPATAPDVPAVEDTATVTFDTVDEYIDRAADRIAKEAVRSVSFDRSLQQPYHIELWSEKALPSAVKQTAERAGVNAVVEGEGHLSYRVAHDFVERVERAGKPAVVFYLTDFDPAGETMPAAMAAKVSWLDLADVLTHRVTLSRLAVTADQVAEYDLPREPVEADAAAYETLADDFQDRHDGGAVELSALEADLDTFREIVRSGIQAVTDDTIQRRNTDEKTDLEETVRRRVADALQNADLDDLEGELRAWVDDFNRELEDVVDTLERLQDLNDESPARKWRGRVTDALQDVDTPTADVPDGRADPPADVMYDSAATYLENVRTIHPDADALEDARRQGQLSQYDGDADAGGGFL